MKTFWRIEKKSHYFAAIELKKVLSELKNSDTKRLEDCLYDTDMEFYYVEKVKPSFWIRLTVPFAFVVMGALFLLLPINYIITGRWGYKIEPLTNWFRSLGF